MVTNLYAQTRQALKRPLFVPFTVLGDPTPDASLNVVKTLIEHGADALELGFPFSDPPADGPIIQAADVRALQAGTTVDDCFRLLTKIRALTPMPIGLLVYYNLVLQRGIDRFYADCASSGVTSVLIADLPLEHTDEVLPLAKKHGIAPVFLVSDVTTPERLQAIAKIAEGYLYIVSYLGVTGKEESGFGKHLASLIERTRAVTELPLIVGFGVQTAEHIRSCLSAGADGVIVGSRIVKEVGDGERLAKVVKEFAGVVRG